jgi:hypothetical protein
MRIGRAAKGDACPHHEPVDFHGGVLVASVGTFDDGRRLYLEVTCDDDPNLFAALTDRAQRLLGSLVTSTRQIRPGMTQLHLDVPGDASRAAVLNARQAVRTMLTEAGYVPHIQMTLSI